MKEWIQYVKPTYDQKSKLSQKYKLIFLEIYTDKDKILSKIFYC